MSKSCQEKKKAAKQTANDNPKQNAAMHQRLMVGVSLAIPMPRDGHQSGPMGDSPSRTSARRKVASLIRSISSERTLASANATCIPFQRFDPNKRNGASPLKMPPNCGRG